MGIKITIPNTSSDTLTFGSANTTTAAQIAGIDSGSSNGQLALYTTASGTSTERVRVDASGNVGIGTSTPTAKATVASANTALSSRGNLYVYSTDTATADYGGMLALGGSYSGTSEAPFANIAGRWTGSGTNGYMQFSTLASGTLYERARIDSSGRLMIGTTVSGGWSSNQKLAVQGSDTWISAAYQTGSSGGAFLGRVDNTAAELAAWYYGGSTKVGSITTNGTTTTYGTLSDHRLKENIAPMTGALEKVALLKPCTYKWKSNGSDGQGFIAHELQAVVPDCVVGEKDAVDAEGNPQYQGIDTSFLVATLTAAIQELKALVDTQASTITSLTDRITALEVAK